MKRRLNFIAGALVGACLFGGGAAIASGITATPTTSNIYVNGAKADFTAYNIGGNNFFKLRDIGEAVDFGVDWDGPNNTIYIDTSKGYTPEETLTSQTVADGSGNISSVPLTEKVLDGRDLSREDFSQQANQAVFGSYSRGSYNAVRQTILDRDKIMAGNNEKLFNPFYSYASATPSAEARLAVEKALGDLGMYYRYELTSEPYCKELYKYDGYFIVRVSIPDFFEPASTATDSIVQHASTLPSDADRIGYLNDVVCDKLTYSDSEAPGLNEVFTSSYPLEGSCASYAMSMQYLSERVGIPCILVHSDDHVWCAVYVDGKWSYVDGVANDVGDAGQHKSAVLLSASINETDAYPQRSKFCMELLVPGSTK